MNYKGIKVKKSPYFFVKIWAQFCCADLIQVLAEVSFTLDITNRQICVTKCLCQKATWRPLELKITKLGIVSLRLTVKQLKPTLGR